ncbi:MAG: hypothetical protein V4722_16510 [Bacteroidota bacterium]
MNPLLQMLLLLLAAGMIHAQGVGIWTSTPGNSAIPDVTGSNKGREHLCF